MRTREEKLAYNRAWKAANKDKVAATNKKWYAEHKEQRAESNAQYYSKNKEKSSADSKRWREENPEQHAANNAAWSSANLGAVNAKSAKRRATKLQQTPSWSETEEIAELYSWAAHLQKVTGILMHVDHTVPLQGKNVSGLHCIDNLKVITAKENLSKGNKHASD